MGTFKTFEEIEVWQKARELAKEIYMITNQGPFSKDFGLRDQIRRAADIFLNGRNRPHDWWIDELSS